MMRKETFFQLNRMVLLVLVFSSLLIPFLYIPQPFHARIPVKLEPIFQASPTIEEPVSTTENQAIIQSAVPASETVQPVSIPIRTIIIFIYLSGVLISFLMFVYSIGSVLLLFRKARKTILNGIRIRVVDHEIPAFSFGRNILVSQHDFDTSYEAIITHEQSHIRLGHFYDLMLMELVKIVFWFNPLVYLMVSDLKEIHEFQADDHTLHSGIDATQYQFLIIQKGVGHQKFALANSFNHCQIKNRITMMNKQKTSKAGLWKVATFLPLLALLLMFCGKTGKSVNPEISGSIVSETTSTKIEGAWKSILSQKIENGTIATLISSESKYSEMKVWTKDYYAYVGNQGIGKYSFGGSGTYKLNGNLYEEKIIYSPVGSTQGFTAKLVLEIKNDTLTQIWPVDDAGKYDKLNYNIIKMVRMK
jgi:beta-lactamase regulating signal transducer with metallopeptidase domain